jgi:hypothetical protein
MAKGLKSVFLWSAVGLVGLIAALFIAGVVAGYLGAQGGADMDGVLVWVMGVFAVLIMIGSLAVGTAWMRSIDEAAQEAHKSAWYWGGSAGMALGGVAIILATLPQAATLRIPSWVPDRADPAAYAATGAFAMLLLMLIGYTIVWAWWWWKRR